LAARFSGRQAERQPDQTELAPWQQGQGQDADGEAGEARSLTGAQIKAGSLTASQINQGTLTAVTASKLASVQYASVTVGLSGAGVPGTAICPAGTNVIGGGAIVSNDVLAIVNDDGPTAAATAGRQPASANPARR
jgi:hypothetical protein